METTSGQFTAADLPGLLAEFAGVWAIEEGAGAILSRNVERSAAEWLAHCNSSAAAETKRSQTSRAYEVLDGVAIVPVNGVLSKAGASFASGSSTVALRRKVSQAARDPEVSAIMLAVDSPGGAAAGVPDAADAIYEARKSKPVWAFVEDLAASAAVWLMSQAERVYVNQSLASVGSIGVYSVVVDQSQRAAAMGLKVHVVRSAPGKGAGEPGTEVTPAQLAEIQTRVDAIHFGFLAAIARGRGRSLDAVSALGTGELWSATRAAELGLVDGVQTWERSLAMLAAAARKGSPVQTRVKKMSENGNAAPAAATIGELRAACKGAPAEWLLAQVEKGATVADALTAFVAYQGEQLEAERKARADAESKASKAAAGAPGVDPVTRGGSSARGGSPAGEAAETGDPVADFNEAVRVAAETGKLDRREAVLAVMRSRPDLHKSYLLATNEKRHAASIEERFARR